MNKRTVSWMLRSEGEAIRERQVSCLSGVALLGGIAVAYFLTNWHLLPAIAKILMVISIVLTITSLVWLVVLEPKPIRPTDSEEMVRKRKQEGLRVQTSGIPISRFEKINEREYWAVLNLSDRHLRVKVSNIVEVKGIEGPVLSAPNASYGPDNVLDLGEDVALHIPRRGIDRYA